MFWKHKNLFLLIICLLLLTACASKSNETNNIEYENNEEIVLPED